MIGIQYDSTGAILATVSPPVNGTFPPGISQLIVPDGTNIDASTMTVDTKNLTLITTPPVSTPTS